LTNSPPQKTRPSPKPRAILAGLIAGIVAGIASYAIVGVVGLVIGFIGGTIVGSRTVLMVEKSKDQPQ
jgi:uncharacterized membrane protein